VPVVEGMRTVSLKPQLVAPGRERYLSVGQTVLRGAAGRLGLRMFHLPGARSSLGVFDPSVVENLSGLTFADREDPNSLFIWKDKLDRLIGVVGNTHDLGDAFPVSDVYRQSFGVQLAIDLEQSRRIVGSADARVDPRLDQQLLLEQSGV